MRVLGIADDGRAKRPRRVDGGASDVDAEKMDGDKREPDGDAGELDRRAFLGHAEDADEKQERRGHLVDRAALVLYSPR